MKYLIEKKTIKEHIIKTCNEIAGKISLNTKLYYSPRKLTTGSEVVLHFQLLFNMRSEVNCRGVRSRDRCRCDEGTLNSLRNTRLDHSFYQLTPGL